MLPGPRGVCDATFVRHEGGTGPHRSEHDCQRSKTTKNDRILSNFTQTGRDPVPKGRLKIAQDEILGTLESRREVPKGRLNRCLTVTYVAWSTWCLRQQL